MSNAKRAITQDALGEPKPKMTLDGWKLGQEGGVWQSAIAHLGQVLWEIMILIPN